MDRPRQIEILQEMLTQLERNSTCQTGVVLKNPATFYTSKDVAAQEWEALFRNHAQIIGLSSDLPEPNTFLTIGDLGVPILATRDTAGRFRAFVNTCRHRAAQVIDEPRGKRSRFTCVWHAWTYSSEGELIGVRKEDAFGEMDKSCLGLVELPAAEQHGLLFVHPQVDGKIDVDALMGGLGPELDSWRLAESTYGGVATIDKPVNWKLAKEIFTETYHVDSLHKNTLAQTFHGDICHSEDFGRNNRMSAANKFLRQLKDRPHSDWYLTDAGIIVYYLFPNIELVLANNMVALARIYPDPSDPGHSVTRLSYYAAEHMGEPIPEGEAVHELSNEDVYAADTTQRNTFSLEAMAELFVSTAEEEDFYAAGMAQKSHNAGTVDHVLIGQNEPAVQHFYRTYRDAMGMPAPEEYRV